MASIYDVARIAAGDPLEAVSRRAGEESALFAQYQHQKDIIKVIKKAYEEAEKRAKKGKGLFGVGGSLLGALLSSGLAMTGAGAAAIPWLSALGSGIGSAVGEKARQDQVRATAPLKRLEAKLEGRKQYEDVKLTREQVQKMQESQILTDFEMGAMSGYISPTGPIEEISDIGLADIGQQMEGIEIAVPEARYTTPSFKPFQQIFGEGIGSPTERLGAFSPRAKEMGALPKVDEFLNKPMIQGLLKTLGPSIVKELFPDIKLDAPEYGQIFRNPYRGGF